MGVETMGDLLEQLADEFANQIGASFWEWSSGREVEITELSSDPDAIVALEISEDEEEIYVLVSIGPDTIHDGDVLVNGRDAKDLARMLSDMVRDSIEIYK